MNLKLIKLLAAICAFLSIIILCEGLYALYAQKNLLASIQSSGKQKNAAVELPAIELTKQPETSYTELVNRPLFITGRRPVAEPDSKDAKPAAVASQTFNWALNGVYTHKKGLYVLLSRTNTKVAKDNFRKVTKESDIDGWKLTEIYKDKIVVSQGDQTKELPLRKPKPKTPGNPGINPTFPPGVPGQPPNPTLQPGEQPQNQPGQPPIPAPEQIPVPVPEPSPEELEPVLEPELIPDETTDPYFENNENEQFQ